MSRALIRALAVVLIAVALGGAKCSKVETNRPPEDRQVDPARARIAQIRVTEATGPYTVMVLARDGKGGVDTTRETIAGGQWRADINYTSGRAIEILVNVEGHPGDRFACEIVDGPYVDRQRSTGGVLCKLTTQR